MSSRAGPPRIRLAWQAAPGTSYELVATTVESHDVTRGRPVTHADLPRCARLPDERGRTKPPRNVAEASPALAHAQTAIGELAQMSEELRGEVSRFRL